MEVVLLIGSRPGAPYRGFHGRYQSFGPLVVYNPIEALPNSRQQSDLSAGPGDLVLLDPDEKEDDEGGGGSEHLELKFTTPSILDDYIRPSALLAERDFGNEASKKKNSDHRAIDCSAAIVGHWFATVTSLSALPPNI